MDAPLTTTGWQTEGGSVQLHFADCLDFLPTLEPGSVDSIVTDPPYGLSFMGKDWDHGVPGVHFWSEALRVAKPGAHLLAFGGTRTFHRLACAIEDAGWQIRDTIMWVYGSGFPKSLDVSKAIDKAAGAELEVVGKAIGRAGSPRRDFRGGKLHAAAELVNGDFSAITAPATDAAKQWAGWGTALKPAYEPIIVARKPLDGTVAQNVLKHGTGGINIDGSRISANGDNLDGGRISTTSEGWDRPWKHDIAAIEECKLRGKESVAKAESLGRWPANLIHDGSEEVLELFPESAGQQGDKRGHEPIATGDNGIYGHFERVGFSKRNDAGNAARFFYCAKASASDRGADNNHPTVKPLDLMRYLVKLVTPEGGVVLDPFLGSGTTGEAAFILGRRFIGIEKDRESFDIAVRRIQTEQDRTPLFAAGVESTPKIVNRLVTGSLF